MTACSRCPFRLPESPKPGLADAPKDQEQVDEGTAYAHALLDRVNVGKSAPSDLALLIGFLDGDMVHGFVEVIHTALVQRAKP